MGHNFQYSNIIARPKQEYRRVIYLKILPGIHKPWEFTKTSNQKTVVDSMMKVGYSITRHMKPYAKFIEVQSAGVPGEGAPFFVWLPASRAV
jgi:hypothetical protein